MPPLPEPMEIFELQDGGVLTTRILRWEEGENEIKPARAPQGVVVNILRIHVPPDAKAHFPYYHDITSKTLRAQLVPLLPQIVAQGRTVTITKHGVAPLARFSVEVT